MKVKWSGSNPSFLKPTMVSKMFQFHHALNARDQFRFHPRIVIESKKVCSEVIMNAKVFAPNHIDLSYLWLSLCNKHHVIKNQSDIELITKSLNTMWNTYRGFWGVETYFAFFSLYTTSHKINRFSVNYAWPLRSSLPDYVTLFNTRPSPLPAETLVKWWKFLKWSFLCELTYGSICPSFDLIEIFFADLCHISHGEDGCIGYPCPVQG